MSKWKLSPRIAVTLVVVPLRCNTPVPLRFPLLENFSERRFCDSLACCLRFLLNLSNPLKRRPFNFIFIRGNSPKSQGTKSILIKPIWLIWHLATSDCSLVWKWSWRAVALRGLKRFKKNRRQRSRLSQKRHPKNFPAVENEGGSVHCSAGDYFGGDGNLKAELSLRHILCRESGNFLIAPRIFQFAEFDRDFRFLKFC